MAYFLVLLIADVKAACYNKVSVLCSLYGLLDEYKKLALVVYLAEYITAIHCNRGEIRGDKCYVEHKDIINAYEDSMKKYVGTFLNARDITVHLPDTPRQKMLWNKIWDEGYVRKILEYEGFI